MYEALIVHVVCDGVNVPLAALWPQPERVLNTYWVPVLPDIGDAYEYVTELPYGTVIVTGRLEYGYEVPSTVRTVPDVPDIDDMSKVIVDGE